MAAEQGEMVVYDRTTFLNRLMGMEESLGRILEAFHRSVPDNLNKLQNAIKDEDGPLVRMYAHAIKGAAGNVCALASQEVALKLEKAAMDEDAARYPSLYDELARRLKEFQEIAR